MNLLPGDDMTRDAGKHRTLTLDSPAIIDLDQGVQGHYLHLVLLISASQGEGGLKLSVTASRKDNEFR